MSEVAVGENRADDDAVLLVERPSRLVAAGAFQPSPFDGLDLAEMLRRVPQRPIRELQAAYCTSVRTCA